MSIKALNFIVLSILIAGCQDLQNGAQIPKDFPQDKVFQLRAQPIEKVIAGNKLAMYGYNSQIPGPIIRAKKGDALFVNFTNNLKDSTTVHWHGIRVENRFDGVAGLTQDPVLPGESFVYKLYFPDEGLFWYHPHIREDIQQELGLYGNIIVDPSDNFYTKAGREEIIFLDDIKIVNGKIPSTGPVSFTLMGRFGNVMLINGNTNYTLSVNQGELVRFYITSSANTRVFNISFTGQKVKLIGDDSGNYQRETLVDSMIISPSERRIIDVRFDNAGQLYMKHTTKTSRYTLGTIDVKRNDSYEPVEDMLKTDSSNFPDPKTTSAFMTADPDYTLTLEGEQSMMRMRGSESIEWEENGHDAMMNSMSSTANVKWIIKDQTGREGNDIKLEAKVGEKKKIRLFNNPQSSHPMQHPIHLHGQRFLILSRDGLMNDNLAWKDTVLVPAGSTIDIMVDFTNPGDWMIHCHIPEHMESGMSAVFKVLE